MSVWTFYYLRVVNGEVSVDSETRSVDADPETVLADKMAADQCAFVTEHEVKANLESYLGARYHHPGQRDVARQRLQRDEVALGCLGIMAFAAFKRASGVTHQELVARVAAKFPELDRLTPRLHLRTP